MGVDGDVDETTGVKLSQHPETVPGCCARVGVDPVLVLELVVVRDAEAVIDLPTPSAQVAQPDQGLTLVGLPEAIDEPQPIGCPVSEEVEVPTEFELVDDLDGICCCVHLTSWVRLVGLEIPVCFFVSFEFSTR